MRFRSLRMKLSLDLVGIADRWWTNRGTLAGFLQNSKELLPSLDMVTLKSTMTGHSVLFLLFNFKFQIRVHFVYYMVEVVCCFFISCLDINVVNISLVRAYRQVRGEGDGFSHCQRHAPHQNESGNLLDPLFSHQISLSARMIIKTAGDFFTANARGVGVGKGFFLFFSRSARAVPWLQRSILKIPEMK